MTPPEARRLAAEIPAENRMPPGRASRLILQKVLRAAPASAKQRVLESLLQSAQAYSSSSQPGHTVWYHHYLQLAGLAAEAFGPGGSDFVLVGDKLLK